MLTFNFSLQEAVVPPKVGFVKGTLFSLVPWIAAPAILNTPNFYLENKQRSQEHLNGIIDSSKYEPRLQGLINKHNQYISKFGNQISPEQRQQMVEKIHNLHDQMVNGEFNNNIDKLNTYLDTQNQNYDKMLGNNHDSGMIDGAMNFMGEHPIGTAIGAGAVGLGGLAAGLSWWKNRQQQKQVNTPQGGIR